MSCRRAVRVALISLALAGCLLAAGCARQPSPELARDELFSLSLGPLDEQLDLFRIGDSAVRHATRIGMRDGLFYITNGNARKVMQLSSYGDLLLIIYDPSSNPAPVDWRPMAPRAGPWPMRCTVRATWRLDSAQRIFVVDTVPGRRPAVTVRWCSGLRRAANTGDDRPGGALAVRRFLTCSG